MDKILILGAGGFIGSHLSEVLAMDKDMSLRAVDISSDKLTETKAEIEFHALNIQTQKVQLSTLIEASDIIVNLVAIANPGMYMHDPISTFQLDFMDNLFVVEECVKHRKRLIQFSSSEVYGKSASIFTPDKSYEFDEEDSHFILGPINKHRWIYSCSKQLLERVIHAHGIKDDLDYTIVRPFNYIGPRIDYLPSHEEGIPRVFSFFMDGLLYNKTMYLINGGEQKRCYTDIRDATEAHKLLVKNANNIAKQQIYNVGHRQNEISIAELADKMRNIWLDKYGDSIPPLEAIDGEEFYGPGYDDSDRRIPNSDKIESLGWKPNYSLDKMLEYTMDYYVRKYRD